MNVVNDSVVIEIIEEFKQRSDKGILKYNTTLDRTDLGLFDWIQHLTEELMDAILYLRRLTRDLKKLTPEDIV